MDSETLKEVVKEVQNKSLKIFDTVISDDQVVVNKLSFIAHNFEELKTKIDQ